MNSYTATLRRGALTGLLLTFATTAIQAAVAVVPIYSSDPADGFNSTVLTNHPIHGSIELGAMRKKVFQAGCDYVGSLFDSSYADE